MRWRLHAGARSAAASPGGSADVLEPPASLGTPQDLQQAYDLTAMSASSGDGDTVAIVDVNALDAETKPPRPPTTTANVCEPTPRPLKLAEPDAHGTLAPSSVHARTSTEPPVVNVTVPELAGERSAGPRAPAPNPRMKQPRMTRIRLLGRGSRRTLRFAASAPAKVRVSVRARGCSSRGRCTWRVVLTLRPRKAQKGLNKVKLRGLPNGSLRAGVQVLPSPKSATAVVSGARRNPT